MILFQNHSLILFNVKNCIVPYRFVLLYKVNDIYCKYKEYTFIKINICLAFLLLIDDFRN